jgi:hypothetical protein
MDGPIRYTVRFDGLDAAQASRAAESLRRTLKDTDPTIKARRVRSDPEALDFGSNLEILLAAPSILELAKGISSWLGRTHSSKVTVLDIEGAVIVENISARDAAGLAEKLQARHDRR